MINVRCFPLFYEMFNFSAEGYVQREATHRRRHEVFFPLVGAGYVLACVRLRFIVFRTGLFCFVSFGFRDASTRSSRRRIEIIIKRR